MNRRQEARGKRPTKRHRGTEARRHEGNSSFAVRHLIFSARGGLGCLLTLFGCQLAVNPFADEFHNQPRVTTPSVDGVLAAGKSAPQMTRPLTPAERCPQDGTVPHTPLYFEDPYEENGSEDGQFAWTSEDYWHIFYWRGRFLVNALLFPVKAVITPPGSVMASDGQLGRRAFGELHDAQKAK